MPDNRKCLQEIIKLNIYNRQTAYTPMLGEKSFDFINQLNDFPNAARLLLQLINNLRNPYNILLGTRHYMWELTDMGDTNIRRSLKILKDKKIIVIHNMVAKGRQPAIMINPEVVTWMCKDQEKKILQKRFDKIIAVYECQQTGKKTKKKTKVSKSKKPIKRHLRVVN